MKDINIIRVYKPVEDIQDILVDIYDLILSKLNSRDISVSNKNK